MDFEPMYPGFESWESHDFYSPNLGEVEGAYWFGPVRASVRNSLAAEKLKNRLS